MSTSNLGLILANFFGMESRTRELKSGDALFTTYVRKAIKRFLTATSRRFAVQIQGRTFGQLAKAGKYTWLDPELKKCRSSFRSQKSRTIEVVLLDPTIFEDCDGYCFNPGEVIKIMTKLGLRPATLCEVMYLCARRKSVSGESVAILGTKQQSASKKPYEDRVPILEEGPGKRKLGLCSKHGAFLSPPFPPGTLFAAVYK
jgi:hypothetical protein